MSLWGEKEKMGLKHVRLNISKSSTYLGINCDLKFSLAKNAENNLNDFDSCNIDSKV